MLKILRGDISSVLSVRPLNPITSVRQKEISQNQRQCDHRRGDRSDEVTSHRKPVSFQSLNRQRKILLQCPRRKCSPANICFEISVLRIAREHISTVLTCVCVCTCALGHVRLFMLLWIVACQVPLSIGFPRQECRSRLPFSTPGIFPTQRLNQVSYSSCTGKQSSYYQCHLGKPYLIVIYYNNHRKLTEYRKPNFTWQNADMEKQSTVWKKICLIKNLNRFLMCFLYNNKYI